MDTNSTPLDIEVPSDIDRLYVLLGAFIVVLSALVVTLNLSLVA